MTLPRPAPITRRIEPKATWTDLVLPAKNVALLRQIAAQVRRRNSRDAAKISAAPIPREAGTCVLFSGASGADKARAAEVIARELGLELHRIDLAALAGKYIGETEKNLRRLFDLAESGGAVLYFDEADALFGKRSDVKDSHDRYANLETSYLLKRIEGFRGLAILATNDRHAFDPAFLRRMTFTVEFPPPSAAAREPVRPARRPPPLPRDQPRDSG